MVHQKYRAYMFCALSFFSCIFAYKRKPEYPIENCFVARQSKYLLQRQLTDAQMQQKLMSLFEAARWSFSSFNNQPWNFIYVLPHSPVWKKTVALLAPFNRKWAQHAGAFIVVTARKRYEYNNKQASTYLFDTGVAVGNLVTQAALLQLVVHPIEGFNYRAARRLFNVPDSHTLVVLLAIGQAAKPHTKIKGMNLKEIAEFQKKDAHPTGRKRVRDFVHQDRFKC